MKETVIFSNDEYFVFLAENDGLYRIGWKDAEPEPLEEDDLDYRTAMAIITGDDAWLD